MHATKKKNGIKLPLITYDVVILIVVSIFLLYLYRGVEALSMSAAFMQGLLFSVCILTARIAGNVYKQIWRYGGIQCYLTLFFADTAGFFAYFVLENLLPMAGISFARMVAIYAVNLLAAMIMRMLYRYAYKYRSSETRLGRVMLSLLRLMTAEDIDGLQQDDARKIKIAIIGAGRIGVMLAEELLNNTSSPYVPVCFVDVNKEKANRQVHGIPVLYAGDDIDEVLSEYDVQEVVFAIHNISDERKKKLYEHYKSHNYKIKVYDYPVMQTPGSAAKRSLREFDIEELLFRKPITISNEKTKAYYRDKVVLITGGGGSIGSELCRQLAKMKPKQIIILDIYENGVYDVQQELKFAYGNKLDLRVEIASITNKAAMAVVFEQYKPQIVINAAAHKHVPLMEHNCVEAIYNNVFGTKNLVELCEEYEAERFMMVSTDKAVNPTNVMGATKRMCEMIVQSASTWGKVKYSATRFGNVLGSAGSVIPLFKRQIANGGPVTLTDKRIIRYFMTIPEASQLVLESGAMAENGDLFVLDMGQPVKILDLAENMIRLSGANNIEIVETGLRPGEKLYEELLVQSDTLTKTENDLIFIEKDTPETKDVIDQKLQKLKEAIAEHDNDRAREALRRAVPTFKKPEEVNRNAAEAKEMQVVENYSKATVKNAVLG